MNEREKPAIVNELLRSFQNGQDGAQDKLGEGKQSDQIPRKNRQKVRTLQTQRLTD